MSDEAKWVKEHMEIGESIRKGKLACEKIYRRELPRLKESVRRLKVWRDHLEKQLEEGGVVMFMLPDPESPGQFLACPNEKDLIAACVRATRKQIRKKVELIKKIEGYLQRFEAEGISSVPSA